MLVAQAFRGSKMFIFTRVIRGLVVAEVTTKILPQRSRANVRAHYVAVTEGFLQMQ